MTAQRPSAPSRPTLRTQPHQADGPAVAALVQATGYFTAEEVQVARELVETALAQGPSAGYAFVFAEDGPVLMGYGCYGPIPAAPGRFDLYWIAVAPTAQRQGIGRLLLHRMESDMAALDGRRIYIETSSRPLYESTQRFYESAGYRLEARLKDFYADGDDKLIYVRELPGPVS